MLGVVGNEEASSEPEQDAGAATASNHTGSADDSSNNGSEGRARYDAFFKSAPIVDRIQAEVNDSFSNAFSFESGASEIIDRFLWLGSKRDANNAAWLQSTGITHILNCADDSARGALTDVLKYCQLDAADDDEFQIIDASLTTAVGFIRSAVTCAAVREPARVLVHCHAGVNRSAAVVIGWLMQDGGLDVLSAVRKVWAARPIVLTNREFIRQLAMLSIRLEAEPELEPEPEPMSPEPEPE